MTSGPRLRRCFAGKICSLVPRQKGFSLIELLIGMSLMSIGLLSIATMFSTGYTGVSQGGRTTMATAAAREILEDMAALPFASLGNLNGFDTTVVGTLPASNPERNVARKWRYALRGPETGWPAYTTAERAMWSILSISDGVGTPVPLGANAQVAVAAEAGSASLMRVTVTVTAPGRPALQIATLISRL